MKARALVEVGDTLRAPAPGYVTLQVRDGALLQPGDVVGTLEVLGQVEQLTIAAARGCARWPDTGGQDSQVRRPVAYGDILLVIEGADETVVRTTAESGHALVFRAPTAGRFYSRPAPGQPRFVEPGQPLQAGQTLCLIEVMKTFHRIQYTGVGLPAQARLAEYLVEDDADVAQGTPLARVEA